MVLQVTPDLWQVEDRGDADLQQVLSISNPGQHQDLGGPDRAGREDDLMAGQIGLNNTKPGNLSEKDQRVP